MILVLISTLNMNIRTVKMSLHCRASGHMTEILLFCVLTFFLFFFGIFVFFSAVLTNTVSYARSNIRLKSLFLSRIVIYLFFCEWLFLKF